MLYETPFYITLPSDVAAVNNNAADWTTKLKHPITLKGRWEVALVELQYVNSIFTVLEEAQINVMLEHLLERADVRPLPVWTYKKIIIPPGNYQSDDDLIRVIEKQIPDLPALEDKTDGNNGLSRFEKTVPANSKAFTIGFVSPYDHRVRFTFPSPRVRLAFFWQNSEHVRRILGFDNEKPTYESLRKEFPDVDFGQHVTFQALINCYVDNPTKNLENWQNTWTADRPVNSVLGVQSMYVYCDIADYSIVGDTSAQILRNVPIKGKKHEIVTERFDIPHYVPVLNNHFESIHLNISNDLGNNVKFAVGKSVVKLHFRPLKLY
jgi:hypothetical protein